MSQARLLKFLLSAFLSLAIFASGCGSDDADTSSADEDSATEAPADEDTDGDSVGDDDDTDAGDVAMREFVTVEDAEGSSEDASSGVDDLVCLNAENAACELPVTFGLYPCPNGALPVTIVGSFLFLSDDATIGVITDALESEGLAQREDDAEQGGDFEIRDLPPISDDVAFSVVISLDVETTATIDRVLTGTDEAIPNVVFFSNQGHFGLRPDEPPMTIADAAKLGITTMAPIDATASAPRSVVVLDTGAVPAVAGAEVFYNGSQNVTTDPYSDFYTGHGPAIADLIGDVLGLPENDASRNSVILHPITPDDSVFGGVITDTATGFVRGYDTTALLTALVDHGGDGDILSLSLSSEGCEELFNAGTHSIGAWLAGRPESTVAAAAGNNQSAIPHYPAAWTSTIDSIVSVGATGAMDEMSCHTNSHASIDVFLPGEYLEVDHPLHGEAVWSGTSFATPQAAAMLAGGMNVDDMATDHDRPAIRQCQVEAP